ncbi:PepSY-associated TM helix domain-containing protein [Methylomonas koyamae]|uniref:PepSY-associated TM helix domain-containing protein n=2 Tax=Methylomonas koyamae TaxID=702114 RepID=UPI001C326C9B|nr:PepSY-associated TM helix domain-containing protein [Methylomonas koyamae]BBL60551.1 peptidase [Methylomonas koyamae]
MNLRPFWVVVHRYAGLAMTVFLVIVGLTGSLLAFYHELDSWLNPAFSAPAGNRPRMGLPSILERVETLAPNARFQSVSLSDDAVEVWVAPKTNPLDGKPYALDFDQLLLNPYNGDELGRRKWGDIGQGLTNLLPFVYRLHYALALGEIGGWILGITALVWTLDSFVGCYLTLPPSRRPAAATPAKPFWPRWAPAWKIKWRGSAYRINFDLHRAGGLWLWLLLLVFAWSSVYMNLSDSVYAPVTRTLVGEYHEPWLDFPDLDKPLENPAIAWRDAYRIAGELMEQATHAHGVSIEKPVSFRYNAEKGFYVYVARSGADIQDKGGDTRLVLDATTGAQKLLLFPSGQYAGNTVSSWLAALHTANVFGMPYRILVCTLGLAIVMLAVTGVVIWLKKRRARLAKAA